MDFAAAPSQAFLRGGTLEDEQDLLNMPEDRPEEGNLLPEGPQGVRMPSYL